MSNILQVFSYNSNAIRILIREKNPWWIAKDVCDVLEIKNSRQALTRLDDDEKDTVVIHDNTPGNPMMSIINEKGLKKLLATSLSPKAIDFAKELGFEVITPTKEQYWSHTISRAFSHIRSEFQYFVEGYKIDLYFPDYKIAVECDEFNHENPANKKYYKNDKIRERKIKEAIGCKFIRFNPDDPSFNIGDVINKIMLEVYKNEPYASSL